MTYTDYSTVGAVLGHTFTDNSIPSILQVSGTLIPLADNFVDQDNLTGLSDNDKKWLSTFMTAHIISVSKNVDFRAADVSISIKNQPSQWLNLYMNMSANKRDALFDVVNE